MSVRQVAKGKKRAHQVITDDEQLSEASSSSSAPAAPSSRAREKQPAVPVKKPKRAETRKCPICDEAIPLRLLAKHAVLESERLEEIVRCIGSTEVLGEAEPDEGLAARSRRKARHGQGTKPGQSSSMASTAEAGVEDTMKTVRMLKRHRKQRHQKLREATRDEEDEEWWGGRQRGGEEGEGTLCPVCEKTVRGDVDVVEAHVDSCLAHLRITNEWEERERRGSAEGDGDFDIDVEGESMLHGVMEGVSFRGTGFDIPNRNAQDVDEDIDIDGEDEAVFGAPQFTERDLLGPGTGPPDTASDTGTDADIDVDDEDTAAVGAGEATERDPKRGVTLRELAEEGKLIHTHVEEAKRTMERVMGVGETEQADLAVELARRKGDSAAVIRALQDKISLLESTKVSSSTSLLCRICLDPYTEPTVSTGCWHTCCRECWLRCLGSTKLCPICKRITGAVDLRRVYL
ncbi:hypothetical protein C2E23DRAFT_834233 [Lenzites betulinus]|nr:hypothetical protein C2E23DRAFT_834233 [Lenzites betulinus]